MMRASYFCGLTLSSINVFGGCDPKVISAFCVQSPSPVMRSVEDVWTCPGEELDVKPLPSSSSLTSLEKTIITLKGTHPVRKRIQREKKRCIACRLSRRKQVAAVPPYLVETAAGQPV
jgi:hypothetical protein